MKPENLEPKKKEDRRINKPVNWKRGLARLGLVLTIVTGAGAVIYQFNPSFRNAADNVANKLQGIGKDDSIPSSFDKTKSEGTMGTSNSIVTNDLSIIKDVETVPSGENPRHDINLLMPIKGIPASGRIDYSKRFTGESDSSPMYAEEARQYAKANEVKDSMAFTDIPKDHVVISPADGYIIFNRVRKNLPAGMVHGAMIFHTVPDGTEERVLLGENSGKLFVPLIPTEFYTGDASQIEAIKVPIKRGQEILRTTEDDNTINMLSYALPSPSSNSNYPDYPTNINLIATPDPSSGQPKVVIVAA